MKGYGIMDMQSIREDEIQFVGDCEQLKGRPKINE